MTPDRSRRVQKSILIVLSFIGFAGSLTAITLTLQAQIHRRGDRITDIVTLLNLFESQYRKQSSENDQLERMKLLNQATPLYEELHSLGYSEFQSARVQKNDERYVNRNNDLKSYIIENREKLLALYIKSLEEENELYTLFSLDPVATADLKRRLNDDQNLLFDKKRKQLIRSFTRKNPKTVEQAFNYYASLHTLADNPPNFLKFEHGFSKLFFRPLDQLKTDISAFAQASGNIPQKRWATPIFTEKPWIGLVYALFSVIPLLTFLSLHKWKQWIDGT